MREGNPKRRTALGESCIKWFSDRGSIPLASTRKAKGHPSGCPLAFSLRLVNRPLEIAALRQFHRFFAAATVCGARNASARCSLRRISTAAQGYALPGSATGGGRARHLVPHVVRDLRPQVQPVWQNKKTPTDVGVFLLVEMTGC